jgi:hypothetical protein
MPRTPISGLIKASVSQDQSSNNTFAIIWKDYAKRNAGCLFLGLAFRLAFIAMTWFGTETVLSELGATVE